MIKNTKFLEDELRKLEKSTCNHNKELEIIWIPKLDAKKEGEVIGNTIYIYSTRSQMALETLRHEFFDLIVSNAIKPYMSLVNALLSVIGEVVIRAKRRLLNPCCRCINLQQMDFCILKILCLSSSNFNEFVTPKGVTPKSIKFTCPYH